MRKSLIAGLSVLTLAAGVTWYVTYVYLNPSQCNDDRTRCEGPLPQTKEEYEARLQLIMRKAAILGQITEFGRDIRWEMDDTTFLYQHSEQTLELMKQTILDQTVPVETRVFAVLLSQCRSRASYERLLEFATEKSAAGALDPKIIRALVIPHEGWGIEPAMSYQDPKIRERLTALKTTRRGADDVTAAVDDVLSGKEASFLKDYYYAPNKPVLPVTCAEPPVAH